MIDFDKIVSRWSDPLPEEKPSVDVVGELFARLDRLETKLNHIETEVKFLAKPALVEAIRKNLPNRRGCI